ncbi:uncharacterized protein LOC129305963 [Prosopis cineraria]|uniref:uncharacterized protein LOC129305963 n=1 Tax=Prosopis cineraria TaxID=364024 RepID=UPI0024107713|nr:uncharacterized protein LOC129305963 [Prosopis cineraria]
MKREGRQHGMVRSYQILPPSLNPRPKTRYLNRFDSPPTAGLFAKVPSKPTNHSKFTGKCAVPGCNACHILPSSKSRHKAKGTHKLKSSDVGRNARLASWRVVDARPGFTPPGLSVTRMLDHLSVDNSEDEGDEEEVGGCSVSPKGSYCFADLFRSGYNAENRCDDDENGFCEGDWVSNEYDEAFISEMGLQVEEDGDWYFVESYS